MKNRNNTKSIRGSNYYSCFYALRDLVVLDILKSITYLYKKLFVGSGNKLPSFNSTIVLVLICSFILTPTFSVFAEENILIPHVGADLSETTISKTNEDALDSKQVTLPLNQDNPNTSVISEIEKDSDGKLNPSPQPLSNENDVKKDNEPASRNEEVTQSTLVGDGYFRDDSRDVLNGLKIDPEPLTGSMQYQFTIQVPPGRSNLTPDLKLQYTSQPSEQVNLYGYGWSDNIPYIERINRKGTDKLYAENFIYSSLDGELKANDTSSSTESYGPKVESGTFYKYEYKNNNKWLLTNKLGTTFKFGYSTSTQQYNSASTTQIFKWMLEEVRDQNNNYIKYEYYHDGNQIYPSKIIYTGNASTDGPFEIEFLRELRTDVATSSRAAFPVVSKYRINQIKAKISGTQTRKYELSYSTGSNTIRSVLSSITETGQDENANTITLPATIFTYQTDAGSKGWTSNSAWNEPEPVVTSSRQDLGVKFLDVNGDGLNDVMAARDATGASSALNKTYIHDNDGWTEVAAWDSPQTFTDNNARNRGIALADLNGDQLVDIIYRPTLNGDNYAYINNGNGWTETSTWRSPIQLLQSNNTLDHGVRLVDVNGDGLTDLLQGQVSSSYATSTATFINNGTGWSDRDTYAIPEPFVDHDGTDRGVRFGDVNGDGLIDILFGKNPQASKVYINNGIAWTYDSAWSLPTNFIDSNGTDLGVRLADINGDGLVDIVQSKDGNNITYINRGNGWSGDAGWAMPWTFVDNDRLDQGVRIYDANGDGMEDIIWHREDANNDTRINNAKKADLLSTIALSSGGTSTIAYKASALYASSTTLLNPDMPMNTDTVQRIQINDGLGKVITNEYIYEGGDYYFANSYDRQHAGFHIITKIDSASTTVKTFYHQGNSTDSANGESADSWAKIGKPYRIEITDSSGNIYTKTVNQWATSTLSNGREFVKLTRKTDLTYDGNSDHKDTTQEYTYDVSSGNLTQKKEWGEVTGSDDGTFTDVGTDDFTTTNTYASTTSSTVHALPSTETTTDHSSNKIAETRHYYDSLTLGNIGAGNETKTEKWKSGSSYINTQKTYNGYGLVTQDTDPRSKNTTYTYDGYNLYVATSTNPLSQKTVFVYDYSLGKPKQVTDINGRVFQAVYDGLDRVKEEKQPDLATPSALVTKSMYTYTDTGSAKNIQKIDYLNSASTTRSYTYLDGLGRIVQERTQAEASNTYAIKDTVYNSLGLKQKESLPYFGTGASTTSATPTNSLYINYTYDPLQRVSTVANAVGTTTYTYDNWMTHVEDPRFKAKNLYHDAYNNLSKVDEIDGVTGYTTVYTYDGLNDLTKITDALGNVLNITYDGLGRRLKAEDLHASSDTTFGSTTYAYDDAGNLTQKIDAKNQTINFTFDDINRPLGEDYTGQAGTEVTYGYDTCPGGIGRLCAATTTAAVANYEYNALGLQSKETKTLNSIKYITSTSYDRQGNITNLVYPDNSQVIYLYNNAGLIEKVNRKESTDANFSDVIRNFDYSPLGQIATTTDGTNMTTVNTYDPTQVYRLTKKKTANGTDPVFQNISYTYDANGNITQLVDTSPTNTAKNAVYTYDDLNRLTQAAITATSSTPWYNAAWLYRIGVTSSSTKVFEDTKDVYLNLSLLPAAFFTNAKTNGCDIRMTKTDGTTELPIDLVSFGTNNGQLHFGTGNSLSATTSTTYYLYYGNASASCYAANATYGAQNVYDSNTKGVWHLEQNSATTGAIIDSTAYAHNGTMYSNFIAHANGTTTGKLGGAAIFDGTDDTIDVPDSSDFEGTAMTLEGWVNMDVYPSTKGENETIFTKKHTASPWTSYALYISSPANRTDGKWTDTSGTTAYAGTFAGTTTSSTWHYVTLRHNPASTTSELSVRTDGSSTNTYTADTTGTTYNSSDPLRFGADWAGGERLDGTLDEIRVHTTAVSDNYITTRFNNMNSPSTFWSIGSPSTNSGGGSYTETYTYSIIGNILTKTGQGPYMYAGTTTGNYANPHAVTKVGTSNYTYDNNGNLLTSPATTNTWDYRNRLIQTVASSTTTYGYDHNDNRVKYATASTTIYYPNQYYNISSATTTKQIFANNALIATITGTSTTATLHYVLSDHLGGSTIITTALHPATIETIDYYPYGSIRLDTQALNFSEQRKFTGSLYDPETQYNYMNARYQNPATGQFISEDPSFLDVGDPIKLKQDTKQDQQSYLADPQQLNSYSYARNNPIVKKDPNGKAFGVDDLLGFGVGGAVGVGSQLFTSYVVTGQRPTSGELWGSFVTGGIIGVGAVNTPETLGGSNAVSAAIVTGLIGGFYGDATKQAIDISTGKQQGGINYNELNTSALITAGTNGLFQGIIPDAKINGLSSGRGNMNAIGEAMRTKAANSTISNISFSTAAKSAVGSQAADLYRTGAGTTFDLGRAVFGNFNISNSTNKKK